MTTVTGWQDQKEHLATRPATGMRGALAVLEPFPQCENSRDAGSDQGAKRKRPGATGRDTDPSRWHGRGRTPTANILRPVRLRRRRGFRGDLHGSRGGILCGNRCAVSHDE